MFTAVDFFAGMGGVSKGLHSVGFDIIKAYDLWEDALKTHKLNLPDVEVECIDIKQLDTKDIPDADLYHFSPPCQSFSTSGKQEGIESLNGSLIYETVRILKDKKPKVFTFENVKGLTVGKNKEVFKELLYIYEDIGYKCSYKIINAYDYGVVQSRERLIIVGIRSDLEHTFIFPNNTYNNKKLIDIIGNIQNNKGIPVHGEKLIEKLQYIPQGGCVKDIPDEIRPKSFPNSYKRLRWEDIPPTITRNYRVPSSANCIHPTEHRGLSDTEALLIQGFDESWEVIGGGINLQIGNSVPPQIFEKLGKEIIKILDRG